MPTTTTTTTTIGRYAIAALVGFFAALFAYRWLDEDRRREEADETLQREAFGGAMNALRCALEAYTNADRSFRAAVGSDRGYLGVARTRSLDAAVGAHRAAVALHQLLVGE